MAGYSILCYILQVFYPILHPCCFQRAQTFIIDEVKWWIWKGQGCMRRCCMGSINCADCVHCFSGGFGRWKIDIIQICWLMRMATSFTLKLDLCSPTLLVVSTLRVPLSNLHVNFLRWWPVLCQTPKEHFFPFSVSFWPCYFYFLGKEYDVMALCKNKI